MTTIYHWQNGVSVAILPGEPGIFRVSGNLMRSRDGGNTWEFVGLIEHDEPVTKSAAEVAQAITAIAENMALADSGYVTMAASIESILESASPLEY